MKKNKGFTLVELLAVIVLLGVLGTIGVVATAKYLTQSREKSYRILSQTIYEAYENCAIQGNCDLPTDGSFITYDIGKLLNQGYLENLKNPYSSRNDCTGNINISVVSSVRTSKEYTKYKYIVNLNCPGIKKINYTWPDDKQNN